jgi:hypothetical protein
MMKMNDNLPPNVSQDLHWNSSCKKIFLQVETNNKTNREFSFSRMFSMTSFLLIIHFCLECHRKKTID